MTPFFEIAGWTLIHFVGQGAAIGLATAAALRLAARRSPDVRYLVACAGLAVMVAAPVVTARLLSAQAATAATIAGAAAPIVAGRPDAFAANLTVRTTAVRETPEVVQAFRPAIGAQLLRALRSAEA